MRRLSHLLRVVLCALLAGCGGSADAGMVMINPYKVTAPAGGGSSATINNLVPPVANEDGPAIADLANLQGKCGTTDGGPYTVSGSLASASATSVTISGLTSATWYCVVYAIDSAGQYSAPSQQYTKVIP
jgi:hypothetical protein